MSGIRLEWAQFGDFDNFDVLRAESPMDINSLPSPLVTGLPTMFYIDETVVEGENYYYRVRAWRDGLAVISSEIKVLASIELLYVGLVVEDGALIDNGSWQAVWATSGAITLTAPDRLIFGNDASSASTANSVFDANANYKLTFSFNIASFAIQEFYCFTNTNDWSYSVFRALVIAGDKMPAIYQRRLIVPLYNREAPIGSTLLQANVDYAVRIERLGTTVNIYLNDLLEISYIVDRTFTNTANIIIKGSNITIKNYKVHNIGVI